MKITQAKDNNEYEKTIAELKETIASGNVKDEESMFQLLNAFYMLLLQYFDSGKGKDNRQEIELASSKHAFTTLISLVKERIVKCDIAWQAEYYKLYEKVLAFSGRRNLECFFDYMELNSDRKVLDGRRAILKPLLTYLTTITFSNELKYIVASYPPSAGKSVTLTYYSAWLYGVDKDNSIIRMSYSDDLVTGFSRSVRDLVADPRFSDVFPEYKQYGDNPFATKEIGNWKIKGARVPVSHIAVSRDGQITGKRANKAMIFDDMIKGASEANDSNLHARLYNQWTGDWINRRDGGRTKYIFIGTMWSPEDILNRIIEDREKISEFVDDPNFKYVKRTKDGSTIVIKIPLLDENDETTCEAIMTTEEARNLRDITDEFQWQCVYQQDPIPAEGLSFADDLLNHFDELPKDEEGREKVSNYGLAVLDTTRRGKDNASMPIFRTDGKLYYMVDCIFQKKAMTDLYEDIIAKIQEHNITWLVIENNTDTSLKALLDKMLEEKGIYHCVITEKYNTVKKEIRIKDNQGLIRKLMVFKNKTKYKPNSDYGKFMKNFTTYSFNFPNRNDDAPDSMALFSTEIILERGKPAKPVPINRRELGI